MDDRFEKVERPIRADSLNLTLTLALTQTLIRADSLIGMYRKIGCEGFKWFYGSGCRLGFTQRVMVTCRACSAFK